ncbi:MAG: Y4yA family PLP-dependent enzyme [Lacipirellulaceae bacterium]
MNSIESLREACAGVTPLTARLEPWQEELLGDPASLNRLVDQYGSPLNLLQPELLHRNLGELNNIAQQHNLNLQVFFARKANKCVSLVEAALAAGIGLDVASHEELRQSLALGAQPGKLILTAAIKDQKLIELAVSNNVCIAIDNADEAQLVREVAQALDTRAIVALRLSGFQFHGEKLFSRFGVDIDQFEKFVERDLDSTFEENPLLLKGLHFHLDGYDYRQRVAALEQCLEVSDRLKQFGHSLEFIDMGGGFPMSYLDSAAQWEAFWGELHRALLGEREPITYQNHALGLGVNAGKIVGTPNVYPSVHQHDTSQWLANVFKSQAFDGKETIAQAITARGLQLRCEPGRAMLNGSGMTVARVAYVKQHPAGHHLIGLSMNNTQCRTMHDDFLIDPLLVRVSESGKPNGEPISGYLTGAYCTESELLTWRRLNFPLGISPGDLVVWPNTAGYFMHFRESRSHQFPLAKNLVIEEQEFELDLIDRPESLR